MLYAKVIVDISLEKLDKTFSYRIPAELEAQIKPGVQVVVPFGARKIKGFVLEVTDEAGFEEEKIKDILGIAKGSVPLEGQMIELASWIRTTYGGTMNQAIKTVLPVKKQMQEKQEREVELLLTREEALAAAAAFAKKNSKARERILRVLIDKPKIDLKELQMKADCTLDQLRKLRELSMLRVSSKTVYRLPYETEEEVDEFTLLNEAQRRICFEIRDGFGQGDQRPSLIHGVTGSGKTNIYLELIADVLREGKQAIVLIPEIALTYQNVQRFRKRFGDQVAVLHSRLSAGERSDQFAMARDGLIKVMIGPRSALFAPFPDLGMIIVDEEHEASYKSEKVPRYHARETAIYRGECAGAQVVLGSATPSVDAYAKAKGGAYRLFVMKERVMKRPLPAVTVVDLREELKSGNRSIFSRLLKEKLKETIGKQEQAMLFLNRRGFAGFVSCRSCGKVIKCPHCDVSLSLHKGGRMRCHYCGYETTAEKKCPSCGSSYIGAFRAGTEAVENALKKEFPGIRVLRMDADTTKTKDSYEQILKGFSRGEADVLLGTQMIVKGHDFPGVTLVGALAADLSLHSSDYRSAERTFQLLTQAAGRAGRGEKAGEVLIQTYSPDHYSILSAAAQDYEEFFDQEMQFRTLLGYPPAWDLLGIYMAGPDEEAVKEAAGEVRKRADALSGGSTFALQIIGPAQAAISKVADQYRMVIYIKAEDRNRLTNLVWKLQRSLEEDPVSAVQIQYDRNPMNGF